MTLPALTPVTIGLLLWAVLAPAGVWVWGAIDGYFDRRAAVAAARVEEQKRCMADIETIRTEIDNAASGKVVAALEAAGTVQPVPADAAQLDLLCKSDRHCRDR